MTPAAAAQMRADTDATLDRFDAGMLGVLTRFAPAPQIPIGEATESDFGDLDEPLRRQFEGSKP